MGTLLVSNIAGTPGTIKLEASRRGQSMRQVGTLLAKYEAALPQHRNYWPLADGFSADAAANPETRKVLRERCRSEAENNPLLDGMIETLAQDLVGSGPRLQLLLDDDKAKEQVEKAWQEWADEIGLADKLRVMRRARCTDGEIFAVFTTNRGINHPVKLDIKLIEGDQVTSPRPYDFDDNAIDGIEFDEDGNPAFYLILKNHPGDVHQPFHGTIEYERVPAEAVIHYFKAKRAGQSRGIPDFAPAMLRCAQYNRFILATLNAAETAASFAGVIHSTAPPNETEGPEVALKAGSDIVINRGVFPVLPHQWDMNQLKAEHPNTNFQMFRREIVGDCARCVNMPVNIAILNSGGMNFASGRLDDRIYDTSMRLDRKHLECKTVERILRTWLREAVLVSGVLPIKVRTMVATGQSIPHQWVWPGRDYAVDPDTEAKAATERINSRLSTYATEYGRQGRDWKEAFRQIALETRFMEELGITPAEANADLAAKKDKQEADAGEKKKGADDE